MKFSFSNLGCPNWDLEKMAVKAKEYGYDGVELRSANDNPYMFPNPPLRHRSYVKDIFDRQGVEIGAVSAYSGFASADEKDLDANRQILINDIILARDLGAKIVRSFLGHNAALTNEQIIENAAPYLNYCCDFADSLGIKVVFETHDMWCSSELIKLAFSKITSKGASVLWDVGNNQQQGETVKRFYDAIGPKCVHIHLKDFILKPDGSVKYCLSGEGDVAFKECLETLYKNDFTGYVTFEWEKRWHPEIAEPEVAFPQFITYVKSIIGEITPQS